MYLSDNPTFFPLAAVFSKVSIFPKNRISVRQLQLLHLVLLLPFLSCQSTRELIHTFGLPRDATYKAFDHIRWESILKAIRRQGYKRLREHL
jgi:hypothetical protein